MSAAHSGQVPAFTGKTHTVEARKKIGAAHYNGIEKITKPNGYVYVYAPEHPRANCGRVPEQILIAERALGRMLRPHETVHHINQVKTDNRNANLLVCTVRYHKWIHGRLKARANALARMAA